MARRGGAGHHRGIERRHSDRRVRRSGSERRRTDYVDIMNDRRGNAAGLRPVEGAAAVDLRTPRGCPPQPGKPRAFPHLPQARLLLNRGVGPFCFITVGSFCVVKTRWLPRPLRRQSVHPHACGERLEQMTEKLRDAGSSPRVWGTPGASGRRWVCERFIPTRVGNAAAMWQRMIWSPVHPHACGERATVFARSVASAGSSPRVWGTRDRSATQGVANRFIPTRVGNAIAFARWMIGATVHPHACGERGGKFRVFSGSGGSSPRVWGTRS